jgi:hypothetical protein
MRERTRGSKGSKMATVAVQAKIEWKAFRDRTSGMWVAICDPLKITVEGETWAILQESISEALGLLMRDLVKTGELEQFLKDRGWKLRNSLPARPENARFDVPYRITQVPARASYDTAGVSC